MLRAHGTVASAVKIVVYVALALLLLAGIAHGQTASSDRLTVGGSKLRPDSTTTVRLDGLDTTGGTLVLLTDDDGDVTERVLVDGDIPNDLSLTTLRGTSDPFTLRNTANNADLLTVRDDGALSLSGPSYAYFMATDNDAAADEKRWRFISLNGELLIDATDDALTTTSPLFFGTRTGDVATGIRFGAAVGLQSGTYASQTTGWAVTAAGAADFRYLYVDELHAKAFIADLEMALNGGQVIAKSTAILAQAFTCPAAAGTTTLWTKDFPGFSNIRVFAVFDWVSLRSFSRTDGDSDGNTDLTIGDCVGIVSSYTDGTGGTEGSQSWTFTRGSGGNAGAMSTSTVVDADAIVIDYGVSGQGFLVARSNDGAEGVNSPYWQAVTWTTAPVAANMTVQTRWGNLNGSYGISTPNTYGFAAGDPANANIVATASSVKLRDGTTDKLVLDGSTGDMTLTGDILLSTGGNIESTGNFSITGTNGLLFQNASSTSDFPRMIRWASGAYLAGQAGPLQIRSALGTSSSYGAITLIGVPSVGGQINLETSNGTSASTAYLLANSTGSTFYAGTHIPVDAAGNASDGVHTLGNYLARYDNINLALDPNAAPLFVIVNKGGGGADANSALGYIAGFSGTKVAGACTFTILVGIVTNVTGC